MTYQRILPATPALDADGTPWSPAYGDVYHSAAGAMDQARHVFLAGNDLPGRWRHRRRFVIFETGFGIGVNFLAAWRAWREDPAACRELHFVSVEKHPFRRDDLADLLARWPGFAPLATELLAAWPPLQPGIHRLHLAGGRVHLTLGFGDAADLLPRLDSGADAVFLDGFAPDRNPDLWSEAVCHGLARQCAPGATLATWSVAGSVREHLRRAGFEVGKRPGFAGKREMLVGHLAKTMPPRISHPDAATVVGGGIAGCAISERLAARGIPVVLCEASPGPADGASGNLAGVFRPLPDLDDSRLARTLRACFLYGARRLDDLPGLRAGRTGVVHLGRDARHLAMQRRVAEAQGEDGYLRFVEGDEAAGLIGWPVDGGGWHFPGGAWINPPSACRALLAKAREQVITRFSQPVSEIFETEAGWCLKGPDGVPFHETPHLVLANGVGVPALAPAAHLPIRIGRGLVSHLADDFAPGRAGLPRLVVTRSGYVTPPLDGIRCAGATLAADDPDPLPRLDDHRENLLRLEAILPGFAAGTAPGALAGRVGFRPMSPDRLPLAGNLAPGLWVLGGFGARGLVWSQLCAELLASRMTGDPLPLEADLVAALDPDRFDRRPGGRARLPASEV
ncbi:MAG: bifunctional tRNA (5-methylaminomethyl-2-thiouridine)(34)-methyltransferase MnmD/FAD-dependent 5-carboxymethylaminomethyl-2-thiouridine(34) oxidoreductase MnmC [Rhodocyclaceae bacterium]|nr:bifunctional tRNA (5-methylaminomethyl-2-thiouridine)(34)-methyltransferase MnmD/FAD-dependent 5-carboxymethylaminomethyl-2-thiouridine(34) oxidoreductase MnmC [Rhodocyclaceae bacterium]